jgi:hypothetical protein
MVRGAGVSSDALANPREKTMKRKIAILIGHLISVAAVVLLSNPLPASSALSDGRSFRPQLPDARDGDPLLAQEGPLRERMREREQAKVKEVARDLEKNPKLLDDPNYLEQHPRLANYLKKHPEAKEKIKQDPKGFFQHFENAAG